MDKIRALAPSSSQAAAGEQDPDLDQLQALILRLGGARVQPDQDELLGRRLRDILHFSLRLGLRGPYLGMIFTQGF